MDELVDAVIETKHLLDLLRDGATVQARERAFRLYTVLREIAEGHTRDHDEGGIDREGSHCHEHKHKDIVLFITKGDITMANTVVSMKDDEKVTLTLAFKDDAGNVVPGSFDAPPTWVASDPKPTVTSDATDGHTAVVTANGFLGSFTVTASYARGGTADSREADFTVEASTATVVELDAGTPEHV